MSIIVGRGTMAQYVTPMLHRMSIGRNLLIECIQFLRAYFVASIESVFLMHHFRCYPYGEPLPTCTMVRNVVDVESHF